MFVHESKDPLRSFGFDFRSDVNQDKRPAEVWRTVAHHKGRGATTKRSAYQDGGPVQLRQYRVYIRYKMLCFVFTLGRPTAVAVAAKIDAQRPPSFAGEQHGGAAPGGPDAFPDDEGGPGRQGAVRAGQEGHC